MFHWAVQRWRKLLEKGFFYQSDFEEFVLVIFVLNLRKFSLPLNEKGLRILFKFDFKGSIRFSILKNNRKIIAILTIQSSFVTEDCIKVLCFIAFLWTIQFSTLIPLEKIYKFNFSHFHRCRMYISWIIHRISSVSWREWSGAISMYYGNIGCATRRRNQSSNKT